MNFFRSEEHLRNWAQFDPNTEGGIISLPDLVRIFSGSYLKRRMDTDYVSKMSEYLEETGEIFQHLENAGSFWKV